MENKTGQKLTEEEMKAYTPNLNLQLTLSSEVNRLRKVVEEKNALIAKFKRYDEERKAYYRRFEQNYDMMEERFNELLDAINSCDEFDPGTKDFYNAIVMRLYNGRIEADKEKSVLQIALSDLQKLQEGFDNLEFMISDIGNVQKRAALLKELQKMKARYGNTKNKFKNNMNKFK